MRRHTRKFLLNFCRLFTAFSFFRLKGADLPYFQWVYPTILSIAAVCAYHFLLGGYLTVELKSFVTSATTLMSVLVGFYIAALAAVTSFPNEILDNAMSGDPVKLRGAGGRAEPLSRRRYLSTLLGYCAFLAMFIYVLGSASQAVTLSADVSEQFSFWIKFCWWGLYIWLLASLFVVTMLCLHYLIDRMHRP